jgi:hypothetical protein
MKTTKFSIFIMAVLWLSSCTTSQKVVIPLSNQIKVEDTYTIIWNGMSEAYRYEEGKWQRAENYDYQFVVTQKRYDNKWKSIKSMNRIHPDYDGKGGDRNQTMYFEIDYKSLAMDKVQAEIHSSLGEGTGTTDIEFRDSEWNIYMKDASSFMPYNKIRISQHYNYEEGLLTETVQLLKEKDGKEVPFMKNEEKAYFYLKGKLDKAPTLFANR